MRKKKNENFWSNGLSMDESRVSVLMILLITFSGFGMWSVVRFGDVPANLVQIILGIAAAVAGVNIVEKIANIKINNIKTTPSPSEQPSQRIEDDGRGIPSI